MVEIKKQPSPFGLHKYTLYGDTPCTDSMLTCKDIFYFINLELYFNYTGGQQNLKGSAEQSLQVYSFSIPTPVPP